MRVEEAIKEYGIEHAAMGRKSKSWKYHARDVVAHWGGDAELVDVAKAASVAKYIGELRERNNAAATIREKLGFLKALCRLSTEAGEPVAFPKRLSEGIIVDNARERISTEAEDRRLQKEMAAVDFDVYTAFQRTGLRSKELALLRVADCHFGKGTARINDTKTGKSRTIPMVGWFREYCARAAKARREYVLYLKGFEHYSSRIVALEAWKAKVFRVALKRAGIKDLRIHDQRHKACTELIERGANEMAVTTIMGWQSAGYIRRYTNLRMKTLQEAMSLLDKPVKGRAR